MTTTINTVMLRRRTAIILPKFTPVVQENNNLVMAFMANAMPLGYILSNELMDALATMPKDELVLFAENVIEVMKNLKSGTIRRYVPMYKNFPHDIMSMEEAEVLSNAAKHYATSGTWLPEDKNDPRNPVALEDEKYEVVNLATYKDYCRIMQNLMAARTVLSDTDKKDVHDFFMNESDAYKYIPDEIPMKENLITVAKACIDCSMPMKYVSKMFKTSTDVLRFAVSLCNGDISLSSNTRFRNIPRKERRFILALLEGMSKNKSFEEDMVAYKGVWIRLGEVLHPGEFKQFAGVNAVFSKLRNNEKIDTYAGKLESALLVGNDEESIKLLSSRPGVFARRLDQLLRNAKNPMDVVNAFRKVASKVPSTTLLQLREHFSYRAQGETTSRVFFPKGNVAKAYTEETTVVDIPKKYADMVVAICENALVAEYATREGMGAVYVDPSMRNYNVPFSMRTASKALKTVARGSSFPLPENCKVVRPFIYWQNGHDRTDIDLSAVVFNDKFEVVGEVAYYAIRNTEFGIYHSGDITNAPHGASEFIDIDIDKTAKKGRYVAVTINSFTNQAYCDLPICFGGWMVRSNPMDGEVFEPTTVRNRFDVSGNQTTCMVVVIDVVERRVIWSDVSFAGAYSGRHVGANNARTHIVGIAAMVKSVVEMHKPNLYDLFTLNGKARGMLVDTPDEADIIISDDDSANIRPTDVDEIMANYL